MNSLVHLRQAPAQKVFLTATLAPLHEQVLAESVGISLAGTLVLRSPTARPNHRIQIVRVNDPQTPLTAGAQLASLLLDTWNWNPDIRGIMFFRSIKDLEECSNSCPFPVHSFHGQMTDRKKEEQVESWLSRGASSKWMLSTTALMQGLDYPQLDAVIFIGCPFGLYDFVQGAGRAGRSGQEALITVFYSNIPTPFKAENEYNCRQEMEKVITDKSCRRLGVSTVMDGENASCSTLAGAIPCDFCEGCLYPLVEEAIKHQQPPVSSEHIGASVKPLVRSESFPLLLDPPQSQPSNTPSSSSFSSSNPGPLQLQPTNTPSSSSSNPGPPPGPPATAVLNAFSAQANAKARFAQASSTKDLLERFGGCFACRIKSPDNSPCHPKCGSSGTSGCSVSPGTHTIFLCTPGKHRMGWIDWRKKDFQWPKDVSRCHFCGLPNNVAGHHRQGDVPYPGKCRYSDSAMTAAWHVLNTPDLFERLRTDLNFALGEDTKAEFGRWVTSYRSDAEEIGLLSVFSWLCRRMYPSSQVFRSLHPPS